MRCASLARRLPSRRCARRTCLRPQRCSRQVGLPPARAAHTQRAPVHWPRARAHRHCAHSRARALARCVLASVGRMEDCAATLPAGRTPLRDGSSTPGSVHGSVHGSVAGRSVAGTTTPRVARDEFSINTDDSDDMLGGRHRDVEQQVRSAVRWSDGTPRGTAGERSAVHAHAARDEAAAGYGDICMHIHMYTHARAHTRTQCKRTYARAHTHTYA